VDGTEPATAVDAVRFAVGTDPELPALGGTPLELDGVFPGAVTRSTLRGHERRAPRRPHP
jgi:hypothetical protein